MFGIAACNAELGEMKPAVKLSISTVVQTCRFLVIQSDELPPPEKLSIVPWAILSIYPKSIEEIPGGNTDNLGVWGYKSSNADLLISI